MKNTIVLLMGISLSLLACNARPRNQEQPPPQVVVERDSVFLDKIVTVNIKDTVLVSKADSLYYYAYVDCVNNKPVLRDPTQKSTKGVKADVKLQDGKLSVNVETEAQNLFLKWKEIYEKQHSGNVKTKPVPYPVIQEIKVPAELTKFEKFYLGVGKVLTWASLGTLLIFILIKIPWKAFFRL